MEVKASYIVLVPANIPKQPALNPGFDCKVNQSQFPGTHLG